MKVAEKKYISVDLDGDDISAITNTVDIIRTLLNAMEQHKCDTLSGNYYEDPINISHDKLEDIYYELDHFDCITEMF